MNKGGQDARRDYPENMGEHGPQSGIIGTVMTVPINSEVDPAHAPAIGPEALADLLGRWPTSDGALYRLLAARIGRLADTGELPAGVRLPPERTLAASLAVSRNTVALAYQVLRDEGMAASRQGSGTRLVPHRTTPAAVHRANGFFTGLLSARPEFDLSLAAVDCAPQVAAALQDPASVLDDSQRSLLTRGTGYFPYGLQELRAAIASMLSTFHGIPTTADQVLVTTGGQQAIDLLLRCEVAPGHPVVTDNPTYPGFIDALYRSGARPVGVPPGHQNPTGLVLPAAERHEIVALARRHPGVTFIDDMTLAELPLGPSGLADRADTGQFNAGPQPPPLAALAPRLPNVVTLGSFSKTYWGGLRTGWVRAPEGIIARLAAAKAAADLGSPVFQQAIVAALVRSAHEEIVTYRADWARQRYAAVAAALTAFLPDWTWTPPAGGLTLWARRPGDADSGGFAQAALRRGVAVVPGRLLSVSAERSPWLRLAFTLSPDDLTTAVKGLASV
jgi:DNA-binding transcriptional MocR family regulator